MALRESSTPRRMMSEDEYLAFEENAEIRHEYVDGHIRAMTGASWDHGRLCLNMGSTLNVKPVDTDCEVVANDARLRIESKHVSYRYPDVILICDEIDYYNNRSDTVTNPVLIAEVLSDSTEAIDRSDKLAEYTKIETLQAYVLISQDAIKVECFMRQSDGTWQYQILEDRDAVLSLPFLDCEVSLKTLYNKVKFDRPADNEPDDTDTEDTDA